MKQALGSKKKQRIERALGCPVLVAYVNGFCRPHGVAEVWLDSRNAIWWEYRQGKHLGQHVLEGMIVDSEYGPGRVLRPALQRGLVLGSRTEVTGR